MAAIPGAVLHPLRRVIPTLLYRLQQSATKK